MKKIVKIIFGVTLLEIMLVLSIAAMLIMMSLRYYQSATIAEQSMATLNQAFAIIAAMESLGVGGTYAGIGTTEVLNYLGGGNALKTATGGDTVIVETSTPATTFSVAMNLSAPVCTSAAIQIKNNKITNPVCDHTNKLTFTFDKTK